MKPAKQKTGKAASIKACIEIPPPKNTEADNPTDQHVNELRGRLWALCSPLPVEEYEPPWKAIAADLWGGLAGKLVAPGVYKNAAAASHLGYAGCVRALCHTAPAVHRVIADIRGLAQCAAPALLDAKKGRGAEVTPGEVLMYDELILDAGVQAGP